MVITSQVLSPLLDQNDFNTAVLFADAAQRHARLQNAPKRTPPPLFTYAPPDHLGLTRIRRKC